MAKLILTGIHRLVDGEYDFPIPDTYTNGDWRTIKRMSGVLPLAFDQALKGGDLELLVAIARIALDREGKDVPDDVLWNAKPQNFDVKADEPSEGDARPPASPPPTGPPSQPTISAVPAPAGNENAGEPRQTSGPISSEGSDLPENPPTAIGETG